MRDCPALKLSVLEDVRVASKRCGQTRLGQNVTDAFLGKIKLRTKTVHPWIGKLATPKEREKAKGKGSPYHREIPWP